MIRYLLISLFFITTFSSSIHAQAVDLFFSEYIEGSGNIKYLEIFNGTGSTIDLSDYEVLLFSNGSTDVSSNSLTTLTGTLSSGSVIVIANSSAEVVYSGDKIESKVTYFNGDDALAIRKKSTNSYVDIFGTIGEDPGSEWTDGGLSTANKTLRRKSSVSSGITTNPSGGFPTLAVEWEMFDQDDISDLGQHTFDVVQHLGETNFSTDNTFVFSNDVDVLHWTNSSTTLTQGLEILRFFANEGGVDLSDQDNLGTIFTNFKLALSGAENIAEVGLFLNGTLAGSTTTISQSVDIELANVELADDTQGTFSVRVILKDKVADHAQLFADVVRIVVSDQGSGFVEQSGGFAFESEKPAGANKLAVEATKIEYTSAITSATANTDFTVEFSAQNALGSVDIDTDSQVSIDVRQGDEQLSFANGSEQNTSFTNGVVSWTISYPAIEEIVLYINSTLGSYELNLSILEKPDAGDLYEIIAPGLTGEALITYLRDNYKVINSLGYNTARDRIFMDIDNKKVNGMGATENTLEGVYTGRIITGFSNRSAAQGQGFNTEHTWPQSKFGSKDPMVSDIHHLYPSDGTANGARGNLPFADLSASEVDKWYKDSNVSTSAPSVNEQGEYSQLKNNSAFEPRDVHKGNVARSMFYFWTMYQNNSSMISENPSFFNGMKNDLLKWHRFDVSDEAEINRSNATKTYQGNQNPFVHDTSLVARAYFPESIVSNEKSVTQIPENFVLHQNYPNPFNPSTRISYELAQTSLVRLSVFDVIGKEVAVLVNANQTKGSHSLSFDASHLTSGIYFVRLESAFGSKAIKMTLIK